MRVGGGGWSTCAGLSLGCSVAAIVALKLVGAPARVCRVCAKLLAARRVPYGQNIHPSQFLDQNRPFYDHRRQPRAKTLDQKLKLEPKKPPLTQLRQPQRPANTTHPALDK